MGGKIIVLAAAIIAAALPAAAQEPSLAAPTAAPNVAQVPPAATPAPVVTAPAAPSPACELHVWPAERFMAQTTGWLSGFGILGALADQSAHADGDKSNRTQLASALSSEGQVDALASLDLPVLLHMPAATIVKHDKPLERHTMNSIKTRRAESAAPCYAELIVGDIFYQKAAIYGRSLRGLFMLRDFQGGTKIVREYKGWGGNGLKLFPPKQGDDFQAAADELVGVFKADFVEFAKNNEAARATRQ